MERNESDEIRRVERIERCAWKRLERLAPKVAEAAKPIWRYGDGQGGEVQRVLNKAFESAGLEIARNRKAP
jgi:hypothetical protein